MRSRSLLPSNWAIQNLPGLSSEHCALLVAAGISTTLELLRQSRTPVQRQALAQQLQVHIQHVNKWVALADLARIPAIGCQYCGLLLHAGVSSPAQLAQISLPKLHQQLLKLQVAMMQRQDLCPPVDQVARWIQQARLIAP
jgi:predicted flap endonuclease-1-like 5' DNA nuclease